MDNPFRNISAAGIARSAGDGAVVLLEIYKVVLSTRYFAADSLSKALKLYKNKLGQVKNALQDKTAPDENDFEKIKDTEKENKIMKKSTLLALVAFLAAVAGALFVVAHYLKKKEADLEEYEDMLFNEDYLSDYLPKEEGCCEEECCCEEAPAQEANIDIEI
ncbi:MAG: hypothetical protein IIV99_04490 [Oscillospiraceae bacterium]|nr:hypothetical protein [Oscillospiraceae bacterium]